VKREKTSTFLKENANPFFNLCTKNRKVAAAASYFLTQKGKLLSVDQEEIQTFSG